MDRALRFETNVNGTVTSYTYDYKNRLMQKTTKNAEGTITTETDARGHRNVEKANEAERVNETRSYTYDPSENGMDAGNTQVSKSYGYDANDNQTSETDSDGSKRTQYLTGASGNAVGLEQSVTLPGEGEDAADTESKLYYLYDKDIQGSTTIHESGGNRAENEICYIGGIYDESTGLYYLNARYYDPDLGVFLTDILDRELLL